MAVIPYFPFGDSSGGGFPAGEPDNVFGTNSGTSIADVTIAPDLATAEATRDAYDTANPGWKDSYLDENLNIALYYQDSGSNYVQYQLNVGGTWTNNQSPIIALQGPPGAEGNSFFFESETARDAFFSTDNNSLLLMKGLPVQVGSELTTVSAFIWKGEDSPATYDADEFKLASVRSGTGSFQLGDAHSMSSAGENVAFTNLVSEISYHPVWQTYESGNPATVRTRVDNPPVTLSDTTADLVNPSWTNVPATSNLTAYQVDVEFTNAVTNLVIDADIDGTDFYRIELGAFSAGVQSLIFNPPIDVDFGQVLSFSVSDDFNGSATLKGNATTGVPYQVLYTQTFTDKSIPTFNSASANIGALPFFDSTDGTGLESANTLIYSESGSDALLDFKSPSGGSAFLEFDDSSDNPQAFLGYGESNDEAFFQIKNIIANSSDTDNILSIGVNDLDMRLNSGTWIIGNDVGDNLDIDLVSPDSSGSASISIEDTIGTDKVVVQYDENLNASSVVVGDASLTSNGTNGLSILGLDGRVEITSRGLNDFASMTMLSLDNQILFVDSNGPENRLQMRTPSTGETYSIIQDFNADLQLQRGMLLSQDTTSMDVTLNSPSSSGSTSLELSDSSDSFRVQLAYNEASDVSSVVIDDLRLQGTPAANTISTTDEALSILVGGGQNLTLTSTFNSVNSTGADTLPILGLNAQGTGSRQIDVFAGNSSPEGRVNGNRGDWFLYGTDTDNLSTAYIKRSGADGTNTGWVDILSGGSGGISGPVSSVDNALSTWNGTDGDTLNSVGSMTATDDGAEAILAIQSPSVTGLSEFRLSDSLGIRQVAIAYNEDSGTWGAEIGNINILDSGSGGTIEDDTNNLTLQRSVILFENGTTAAAQIKSPSATGTSTLEIIDSTDTQHIQLSWNETSSIASGTFNDLALSSTTSQNRIDSSANDLVIATSNGQGVTIASDDTVGIIATGLIDIEGSRIVNTAQADFTAIGDDIILTATDNDVAITSQSGNVSIDSTTGSVSVNGSTVGITGTGGDVSISTTNALDDVNVKGFASFTESGGGASFLDLTSLSASGTPGLRMLDSSGAVQSSVVYAEIADVLSVQNISGTVSVQGNEVDINATGSEMGLTANQIDITANNAENSPFMNIGQQSADIDVYATTTAQPDGGLSGNPGDVVLHQDGEDSGLFVNFGASSGNTRWANAIAGSIFTWGDGGVTGSTTTRYLTPGYDQGAAPTTPVRMVIPRDGYLRNLHVYHNTPGTSPNQILYEVRVNDVVTGLSLALAESSSSSSNTTTVIAVSAGDTIDIEVVKPVAVNGDMDNVVASLEFI